MADAITVPNRADYEAYYLRSVRLRNRNASTGPDEYYSVQARCLADQLVGISGMANTIAGKISLRDMTGDQLDNAGRPTSEGGLGLPRPVAVGSTGYLTIQTVEAGADVTAGLTLQTAGGVLYAVASSGTAHYYNSNTFPVVCLETGPETNLEPGTVLTWVSPPSGCFASATVAAANDGSGLIGGRDALGDDDYRELLADAQANPAASANDAELQRQIQYERGHGVSVKRAFTYPCCLGPGVTGFTCVLEGSAKYGSRAPTNAQLNLISAWVEQVMPSTDLLWRLPMFTVPLSLSFRVKFANNGWSDAVQWPPYSGGTVEITAGQPYYGVGPAGLASLSTLTPVPTVAPGGYHAIVAPSNQKFYTAYPAAWGIASIYAGQFYADMLPPSLVTFAGVEYYLFESTNLLTYPSLDFWVAITTAGITEVVLHYIVTVATSPTVFTVSCSDGVYAARSAPHAGQHIALYDNQTGKFKRKTIKSVSGSGPWVITCETLANASDLSYLPVVGQMVSPWSDSLQSIADLAVKHANMMGPGEMISETPLDGIRMTRSPKPTPTKWPYEMTTQLEGEISQLPSVQRATQLDGLNYVTPAGTGAYVNLASLFDLGVYPL